MKSITHTYQFGRLHIVGAIPENKESFFLEAFSKSVYVSSRKFRYMVTNGTSLDYKGNRFIYGELVKYKQLLEGEVINEKTKQILIENLPFGIIASTKFFIHCDSQIIAFHPVTNRISENQVMEFLARLIEKGHDNFFVSASIDSLNEDIELTESIRALRNVYRISLQIRPTNPNNRPIYRNVDERLKKLEIAKEQRTIIGTDNGLNIDELVKDDVYKSIFLVADGYGSASVSGETEDGKSVTIKSEDSPVVKKVADNDDPQAILAQLHNTILSLWSRTHEDED